MVNYVAGEDVTRKDGITFRLHQRSNGEMEKKLFKEYLNSHSIIKNKAIKFARLMPSVWDESVEQWRDFTSNSGAYNENMEKVVSILELRDGMNILEVACGLGKLGKLINDENMNVNLYLSDNSGQMLKACGHTINNNNSNILYFDPVENSYNWKMFFPDNTVFDRIVSHLSFPFPEMISSDFERLIDFFDNALANEGTVVISIHNTAIMIDGDVYIKDSDEFRNTLNLEFITKFGRKVFRELKSQKISETDFLDVFKKKGFCVVDREVCSYDFSMHDRVRLWSTPAVLNTMFDIDRCNKNKVTSIMSEMFRKFRDKNTPSMSTIIFTMKKESI